MKRFLLLLLLFGSTIAIAQTTWTGLGTNTNWNNTDNWDNNLVPTASDDVIIPTGFTVTLNVAGTIKSLDIQGNSVFDVNNSLTFTDTYTISSNATVDWNSGILQGDGTLTNNGTMNLPTTSAKSIYGTTVLNNEGMMNFQSTGYLYLFGDATLNNTVSGVIDFQDNAVISYSGSGAFNFNNQGILKKTAGAGVSSIQTRLTNTGTISVESGTLTMNSLEKTFNGGVYNVTTGNTLLLSINVNINGTLTGQIDGSFNLASTLTVATTAIFDFTGPSGFNWNSGILQGDGTLTNSGTMNLATTSAKSIYGTTVLNNEGVMNFQSTAYLYLFGDATLNNAVSGVIDFQDNAVISYFGGGTFSFNNAGLLTKTIIAGTSLIFPPTTNSGTIDVQMGELEFIGSFGFNNTIDGIVKGIATIDLPPVANFTNDGTFAPGASPGVLTVLGDFKSSSSSILDIELDGLTQGTEYDLLNITGTNVIFDGTVNVALGFDANIGDTFTIATVSGIIAAKNLTTPVYADYGCKQYTFDITYPGDNEVLLTISDKLDIEPPTVATQNIVVQLDASGNASITADQIDNGSVDNCTLPENLIFDLDITDFTCSDLGDNTVSLTVTDEAGNFDSANATVTVEDSVNPTVVTQNTTIQLDAFGNASITLGQIDNGSTDNCSVSSLSLDVTDFTCSDLGANTVNLTVTDQSGNTNSASATVTVEDNIDPVAITQSIAVQLDASGNASIVAADINNASTDNCGIASMSLDVTAFTCSDLGANTVNLTVTDTSGNTNSASATVTVEDNIDPVAITQNIAVQLDASGNASIVAGDIDNGSSDNCSVSSLSLDITDFTCADIGDNTVELTVTDQSGNSVTASATVTVSDGTLPEIICPSDFTVSVSGGNYTVPNYLQEGDVVASDNCDNDLNSVQTPTPGTVLGVGMHTITVEVTDDSANTAQCTFVVTVENSLGIDDQVLSESSVVLFPNPAKDFVTLKNNSNIQLLNATIVDLKGSLIQSIDLRNMAKDNKVISTANYQSGVYFIQVSSAKGLVVKRLIKQ